VFNPFAECLPGMGDDDIEADDWLAARSRLAVAFQSQARLVGWTQGSAGKDAPGGKAIRPMPIGAGPTGGSEGPGKPASSVTGSVAVPAPARPAVAPEIGFGFRDEEIVKHFSEIAARSGGVPSNAKQQFATRRGADRSGSLRRQRASSSGTRALTAAGGMRGESARADVAMPLAAGQGGSDAAGAQRVLDAVSRASALASGSQAAVVKMVSTGGGRGAAAAMVTYNSREAKEALERETGELVLSVDEQKAMLDEWEAFFDKREPSKDVLSLTVSFDRMLLEDERRAYSEAVGDHYAQQRLVSGFGEDENGNTRFVAVLSVASAKTGRVKSTPHALEQLQQHVAERLGQDAAVGQYAFRAPSHGVRGVEEHLLSALDIAPQLQGRKDAYVEAANAGSVASQWERSLRSYGGRDVMHLVISSKAGTDEKSFVEAARDFLGSEFGNHKYAFALHGPNDTSVDKRSGASKATDHVHVHAMIVMKGIDGKRLDPNIADFKRWRESIAVHARAHGIDMVATRRVENVNAPTFSKAEHELVKSQRAAPNTIAKVAAKREGEAVYPRSARGQVSAIAGRQALRQVIADSRVTGDGAVELAAARLAKRHDDSFSGLRAESATARRDDSGVGGLISRLQSIVTMLQSGKEEGYTMAQQQVVAASVDELQRTTAKISESLRGDPGLKAKFDKRMQPTLEKLKAFGDNSVAKDDLSHAIRSRALEAQATENADAFERQARAKGPTAAGADKAGEARSNRADAQSAKGRAEAAENRLRANGVETAAIKEAAVQTVQSDEIRPDIQSPQKTPENDNSRKGRKR
jgi:hypothetical protein